MEQDTATPERETYRAFAARLGLRLTASESTPAAARLAEWPDAYHFRCRLILKGRPAYTFWYSMGSAHAGKEPELDGVLSCLASDASGYENARTFEEFCGEYGYETDSRKAERIYRACGRAAAALKRLLGDVQYERLLWETDEG